MTGDPGVVAGILGRAGRYRDPMWAIEVELTPAERWLLRTWDVRRLQFVAHAGAAALTTHQTYSRLEHSLGLLTLVTHFAPDDTVARVAALLHDVGHLPFSHTFERVAGLDHHELGVRRIRALAPELAGYGIDAEEVIAVESGAAPSVLNGRPGALKLDHLESFLRSGRAHGRVAEEPARTLARLDVVDGAVQTDVGTARYLAELAYGEAGYLCAWENIVATAVLRGLAGTVLADGGELADRVPRMTDDELWAVLLSDLRTGCAVTRSAGPSGATTGTRGRRPTDMCTGWSTSTWTPPASTVSRSDSRRIWPPGCRNCRRPVS